MGCEAGKNTFKEYNNISSQAVLYIIYMYFLLTKINLKRT